MMRHVGSLVLLGLVVTVGCDSKATSNLASKLQNAQRSVEDAGKAVVDVLKVKKEEYRKVLDSKLVDLDGQLKVYQTKIDAATGDAKVEMQKKYDELNAKRKAFGERLKELSVESKSGWEEIQSGLEKSWNELKESAEKAKDSFK